LVPRRAVTLVVAVTTGDGIVLAADSRVTFTDPEGTARVRTDSARKITRCERFGIGTSGWASLSGRSASSHLEEFAATSVDMATPELLCDAVAEFVTSRIRVHVDAGLDPAPEEGSSVMQCIVVGYHEDVGEVWKVLLPSKQKWRLNTTQSGGAIWQGDWEICDRIFTGICPSVKDAAERDQRTNAAYEALTPTIADAELVCEPLLWTLQEAVDFAAILIRTTRDIQRFTDGRRGRAGKIPSVGGATEISVVDSSGFRWLSATELVGERP
jgi:hypothetical protein